MSSRLTDKKRKFLDAYLDSCKTPGDLSTGNVKAAAQVAGYAHPRQGFRLINGKGEVVDEAAQRYVAMRLDAEAARIQVEQRRREAPSEDMDIATLESIRDDQLAPHGSRVRATELLLKARGADRPTDEVEEDPETALRAMLVLLGVEDVEPLDFLNGRQANRWTCI